MGRLELEQRIRDLEKRVKYAERAMRTVSRYQNFIDISAYEKRYEIEFASDKWLSAELNSKPKRRARPSSMKESR
jgi:hypothetical protein